MYQRNGNWVTEFYHDGIRYKKSLGKGISKTVAKEREAKYRQEVREGKHNAKARRIRFETFSTKYLEHARVNKKPKSAKRNEVSINMLMPFFKGMLISSIHPFSVEQYKKDRRDAGASPGTVNRDVATMRNMMNMAVQWGYLQINPVATVKQLHEDNETDVGIDTTGRESSIGRMSEEGLPPGSGTICNLYRDAARRDLQPYVGPCSPGSKIYLCLRYDSQKPSKQKCSNEYHCGNDAPQKECHRIGRSCFR